MLKIVDSSPLPTNMFGGLRWITLSQLLPKTPTSSERSVLDGCPPKVIWLRIGNCNTARARVVLPSSACEIGAFLSNKQDCCLVISTPMP
jgi:hypothetical protein